MWLSRLDLISFGRFTNVSLNLGPGFHLVYGPNEAGKSTTLRAVRQLLYGFDERTADNFLHSNPNLRIGGAIHSESGVALEVIRRKARKDSLRALDDTTVIDPVQWQDLIGNVDLATFRQRYGIDYAQLVEGGRQIATGTGDLGEILFATGSGVSDLSAVCKGLADEAAEIFRPQGKKQRLNQALVEWQQRKDVVIEKLLSVSIWEETDRLFRETKVRLDETLAEWKRSSNECEQYQKWQKSVPLLAELDSLRQQLTPLTPVPRLSADFGSRRQAASLLIEQATSLAKSARESIRQAQTELDRLTIPDAFTGRADDIARIVVEWGGYQKAQRDRPKLVEQQTRHSARVEELRLTLGNAPDEFDPSDIVPDRALRTRIGVLGRQHAALVQSLTSSETSLKLLDDRASHAETEFALLPAVAPVDELHDAVKRAQSDGDLEQRLEVARAGIAVLRDDIQKQLLRIGLGKGSIDDLRQMRIPTPERMKQFEHDFEANQTGQSLLRARLVEFEALHIELDRQIDRLRQEFQVPTEADLESARNRRTADWSEIRGQSNANVVPNDALLRSFEQSLDDADHVADRLRHEADRVAQLAEQLDDRTANETHQHDVSVRLAELEAIRLDTMQRWQREWPDLSDSPLLPRDMQTWLLHRETLLRNHSLAAQREEEANELATRIETHVLALTGFPSVNLRDSGQQAATKLSLEVAKTAKPVRKNKTSQQNLFDSNQGSEAGSANDISPLVETNTASTSSGSSLKELLGRAESVLNDQRFAVQRRRDADDLCMRLKKELAEATERAVSARRQLSEWQSAWHAAMSEVKLSSEVTPDVAEAYLVTLGELAEHRQQADQLGERISGIDADAEQFVSRVKSLCSEVAPEFAPMPIGDCITSLGKKLTDCQRDESVRNQQTAKRDQAEEQLVQANESARRSRDQFNELCLAAGIFRSPSDSADGDSADDKTADDDSSLARHAERFAAMCQELEQVEKRAALRHQLEEKCDRLLSRLSELAGDEPLDEFLERVRQQPEGSLESKVLWHEQERGRLADERDRLNQQLGGFELQLRQMDGSSAAADAEEERRVWLAQIRSDAEQFIRLKLASSVLQTAIERYREKTRGPVLKIASEIFRELTLGSFEGLRVEEDDSNRPVIAGIRTGSRESILVSGMSEGTCDQMYLALRLASLQLETPPGSQVPFIIDDILIQFDDARAAAALRVFARFGKQRQVIFFTHHEHLLQIAGQHIPGEHKSQRLIVP